MDDHETASPDETPAEPPRDASDGDHPQSDERIRGGRVVGAGGCRGGWVATRIEGDQLHARFHETFLDLIAANPHVACIAVDVPIGLTTRGPRLCDKAARRMLGERGSSVFPAPDPRMLSAADLETATMRARMATGKGVSRQAFALYRRVAEVDQVITPPMQSWVVEIHPEVSYWAMAGDTPMAHSRSTGAGYDERRALLSEVLGLAAPTKVEARALVPQAVPEDLLDAIVAAWSARRIADGVAGRVDNQGETDRQGRRMEILY